MNASQMTAAQRVWWLLVLPALAGLGVVQLLDWLPQAWVPWVIAALALAGMVWAVREIRWAKRTQRELEQQLRDDGLL